MPPDNRFHTITIRLSQEEYDRIQQRITLPHAGKASISGYIRLLIDKDTKAQGNPLHTHKTSQVQPAAVRSILNKNTKSNNYTNDMLPDPFGMPSRDLSQD